MIFIDLSSLSNESLEQLSLAVYNEQNKRIVTKTLTVEMIYLISQGKRIEAIKIYKDYYNSSLREAKMAIDNYNR